MAGLLRLRIVVFRIPIIRSFTQISNSKILSFRKYSRIYIRVKKKKDQFAHGFVIDYCWRKN